MIQVVDLKASLVNTDTGPVVEWGILPTTEDLSLYRFTVERSESPEGDFDDVSPPLVNQSVFPDKEFPVINDWRKPFYRIRAENSQTGESKSFNSFQESGVDEDGETLFRDLGPATIQGTPDFPALEVVRRNNLILRRFHGIPCAVLIQKTFGQHCPECFDFVTQRQTTGNCPQCFNTGWTGGFYNPINVFVNFNPRTVSTRIGGLGEEQMDGSACWLSNFPILKPRDIIVNMVTGERWRVVNIRPTKKLEFVVHQTCNISALTNTDIENRIPVEVFGFPEDSFQGFGLKGSGLL